LEDEIYLFTTFSLNITKEAKVEQGFRAKIKLKIILKVANTFIKEFNSFTKIKMTILMRKNYKKFSNYIRTNLKEQKIKFIGQSQSKILNFKKNRKKIGFLERLASKAI
jgi:hypothetical protein